MSGSVSVIRQLLAAGPFESSSCWLHPTAVRKGMRVFDEGESAIPLELVSSEAFTTGVCSTWCTSRPTRSGMSRTKTPRCTSPPSGSTLAVRQRGPEAQPLAEDLELLGEDRQDPPQVPGDPPPTRVFTTTHRRAACRATRAY